MDTRICDIDDLGKTCVLFQNGFEVSLCKLVQARSQRVIVFGEGLVEFLFRKRGPNCSGFRFDLVKDFFVNWSMES